MNWNGVMPAVTTCFDANLRVDHRFMAKHFNWLLDNGCTGIVTLGSLGEGATLSFEEKIEVVRNCVTTVKGRAPVVASVAALSTEEAVTLARASVDAGCDALMVLPPYVYQGDWREMKAHVGEVFRATPLACMLYNNPAAYGTDFLPEQIQELAEEHENFEAVKESSADVRRVAAIRALLGDRLEVSVGVDDVIVEGVAVGAVGWIAGLANALPRELLRMDTVPEFVQLIKLVQTELSMGNPRVRPPRLELVAEKLERAQETIHAALQSRPKVVNGRAVSAE
jgi:4-hydroxy-tetrahydrodipicolinate synthase